MSIRRIPAFTFCLGSVLMAACCQAQSARTQPMRISPVTFPTAKPVLGLPLDTASPLGCTADNLTYFTSAAVATGLPSLYSVSQTGEVKRLLRPVPLEFNTVSALDFFPAGDAPITLVKAEKRDDDGAGNARPPRETAYFLSLAGRESGSGTLLPLDIHFKPLRLAVFGSGEYLLLGWDQANLLPVLAVLKEDGSIRRFLDSNADPKHPFEATLEALQGAVFVPFGGNILLTYPRTAKPLRVISQHTMDSFIPLALPAGYVLHDVVGSGSGWSRTIVARVQLSEDAKAALSTEQRREAAAQSAQRLFEFRVSDGARVQEYTFARQSPADITCAAGQNLTALFLDDVASPGKPPDTASDTAPDKPQDQAKQWMVGSYRR